MTDSLGARAIIESDGLGPGLASGTTLGGTPDAALCRPGAGA
jgi:hypothetical protein